MLPAAPLSSDSGTNTETNTAVMPTTAPEICPIAFLVACFGLNPSSAIIRSTFSTTTIASSTTMPITSTMANIVITLIDMPRYEIAANAPSREIGTTMVGISVYRKFCRKINITINTSTIASASVCTTLSIDNATNLDVLYGEDHFTPCGKKFCNSFILASIAVAAAKALPELDSDTAMPAAFTPFK